MANNAAHTELWSANACGRGTEVFESKQCRRSRNDHVIISCSQHLDAHIVCNHTIALGQRATVNKV